MGDEEVPDVIWVSSATTSKGYHTTKCRSVRRSDNMVKKTKPDVIKSIVEFKESCDYCNDEYSNTDE